VIAERAGLSEPVVNALVNTRDLMTAKTLVGNRNAELTEHALRVFSVMTQTEDSLTKPLLARPEITNNLVREIYDFVSQELKSYIEDNFDIETTQVFDIALQESKEEIVGNIFGEFAVTTSMVEEAETLCRNDMLTPYEMINYLKRGQIATFTACFSVYCGLPIEVAEEMLRHKKGQGLAVACRAMSVQKTDFINMFLLTSRLRDDKVVEHRQLSKAIQYFDTINMQTAEEIMASSRH